MPFLIIQLTCGSLR